ncbi:MAG: peptidoglycan-associated lipoprotein Pal [Sphingomonas sp.]|nr:peptidoglycan-associated lipoprotein Pal [Sphingomonas sp.]
MKIATPLLLTAALLTAACASKRPEDRPPVPADVAPPAQTTPQSNVGDAIVPGSAADFKRSVTSDTIHFALDQYDIDAESRAILDSQVAWLRRYPQVRVTIEGHCDERGTREYNLALGDRRANAAKNYLASAGIDASRITTISYGKERPIALGSDEASWAQNRRAVTIVIS